MGNIVRIRVRIIGSLVDQSLPNRGYPRQSARTARPQTLLRVNPPKGGDTELRG